MKNPTDMASPPSVKFKVPSTWTSNELRSFLDSLKTDRWAAIHYLACTGMRKGEILGLPLKALDIEIGFLRVVQTLQFVPGKGLLILDPKTERSRRLIRLPKFVREALKDHLTRRAVLAQNPEWKESGLVFTINIGTPITPRNMLRHFKNKLSAVGSNPARGAKDRGKRTAIS